MNPDIYVVHCPSGRCEKCSQRNDMGCNELCQISESRNESRQVILVEKERGLLHFCEEDSSKYTEPSWRSDGWETVFVGMNNHLLEGLDNVLAIYKVGAHLSIFKRNELGQTEFFTVPLVRTALEHSLIDELSNKSMVIGKRVQSLKEGVSQKLQRVTKNVSKHIMKMIPEISETTRMKLSEIIAHRRSVLGPLMPIILDDLVEEIYLDRPGSYVYFDHQRHGRCNTTITFHEHEVPRIVTLIRAESNLHLDRSNPSLKMDLQIQDASLRFSASLPPLSPDGLHLEIRRARNRPFSIRDLMDNGTITPEIAAILIFAVSCRFNITITGGPGTGKTTLLNALDMTTPKWWRKIYIEDAIESRKQKGHHQVRFRVDPLDEHVMKFSKSDEIIKCLHRSPDYLILGEIQTVEHSQALFQAIIAGLRTIQTCHSESSSSLISRWKLGHGIKNDSLSLMDVIVTLDRPKPGESVRRVSEISEIRRKMVNGLLEFSGLNIVFDSNQGFLDNWAQDGAFMNRARDSGVESHVPAISNLIDIIRHDMNNQSLEMLSEEMWFHGHPMRYSERKV